MDWANERWVKLYTRDTVTWTLLSWQARALLCLVLRKVDRSGRLELGRHGAKGLAAAVAMPVEVVEVGLDDLLGEGVVVIEGSALYLPHFEEAQQAHTSVAERSRRHRERKESNTDATRFNGAQRAATHSNAMQHDATIRTDQNRSEQIRTEEIREDPPYKSPQGDTIAGEPGSLVAGLGVAAHGTEASEPAQDKPEAADAMPSGFALKPPAPVSAERRKVELYSEVVVGWLNTQRRVAGLALPGYQPHGKTTLKQVARLRKQGWTPEQVIAGLELRIAQWRRAAPSDWHENLIPSTSLNGKLDAFVEQAIQGHRPQEQKRGLTADDLYAMADEMEAGYGK